MLQNRKYVAFLLSVSTYGPDHDILVLIAYSQMPLINTTMLTYLAKLGLLNFGRSLHLHAYFGYASNEDSGESAHMQISSEIACTGQCMYTL